MAPEYDKLVETFKEKRTDIIIARLDASSNEKISGLYEIFSFPNLLLFHPGSTDIKTIFKGRREASVMAEWIESLCPKIEIEKKLLENSEEKIEKTENIPEIIIQNKNNSVFEIKKDVENKKPEINNEDKEWITKEMDIMKNKIIFLEKEIEGLKNNTGNFRRSVEESKIEGLQKVKRNVTDNIEVSGKLRIIGKIKDMEGLLVNFTMFDVMLYLGVLVFIAGTVITIRKIFFKNKNQSISIDHHPKV